MELGSWMQERGREGRIGATSPSALSQSSLSSSRHTRKSSLMAPTKSSLARQQATSPSAGRRGSSPHPTSPSGEWEGGLRDHHTQATPSRAEREPAVPAGSPAHSHYYRGGGSSELSSRSAEERGHADGAHAGTAQAWQPIAMAPPPQQRGQPQQQQRWQQQQQQQQQRARTAAAPSGPWAAESGLVDGTETRPGLAGVGLEPAAAMMHNLGRALRARGFAAQAEECARSSALFNLAAALDTRGQPEAAMAQVLRAPRAILSRPAPRQRQQQQQQQQQQRRQQQQEQQQQERHGKPALPLAAVPRPLQQGRAAAEEWGGGGLGGEMAGRAAAASPHAGLERWASSESSPSPARSEMLEEEIGASDGASPLVDDGAAAAVPATATAAAVAATARSAAVAAAAAALPSPSAAAFGSPPMAAPDASRRKLSMWF